ncbi:MAG: hypothetical protein JO149_01650 [Gammaproteobacteria bacterium]|nr:hypothetical protein [Gammaproteobacteria bacterium]
MNVKNFLKNFLKKIDELFCNYLGLDSEIVSPNTVEIKRGQLLISNTVSFKRHHYIQKWDDFSKVSLNEISKDSKDKLGMAIGKTIAKNLIVSFEDVQIEGEIRDA